MLENEDSEEEEKHHVKTGEKTHSQTESISLLERRDKKCYTCREFHMKTESRDSREDPHWRETVSLHCVWDEFQPIICST
ncbi:hypothetical protein F2P79_025501, partial [Pimephales promelas]